MSRPGKRVPLRLARLDSCKASGRCRPFPCALQPDPVLFRPYSPSLPPPPPAPPSVCSTASSRTRVRTRRRTRVRVRAHSTSRSGSRSHFRLSRASALREEEEEEQEEEELSEGAEGGLPRPSLEGLPTTRDVARALRAASRVAALNAAVGDALARHSMSRVAELRLALSNVLKRGSPPHPATPRNSVSDVRQVGAGARTGAAAAAQGQGPSSGAEGGGGGGGGGGVGGGGGGAGLSAADALVEALRACAHDPFATLDLLRGARVPSGRLQPKALRPVARRPARELRRNPCSAHLFPRRLHLKPLACSQQEIAFGAAFLPPDPPAAQGAASSSSTAGERSSVATLAQHTYSRGVCI